jgi:hypothetical protein
VEYYQRLADWQRLCDRYLEYFKSRLFVDLREVKIQGSAIEISGRNEEEVNAYMEAQNVNLTDQPVVKVPHDSWIFSNIDWENSALITNQSVYYWVHFSTKEMISSYPIPPAQSAEDKVNPVGDLYVLDAAIPSELAAAWAATPSLGPFPS